MIPQQILANEEQALPKNWKNISLKKMKLQVIDGDTFDADFNRNGRFSNPQERVRLLYVDTPELKKSHKGKDPKLGLPAKGFLKSVLSKTNAVLWVDPKNKTGNYGRLLAVLEVKGLNINLALIKRGHSYFNTRHAWPNGFKTYALAEAHAFEKRLGIWSYRKSRKRYLLRLWEEGKLFLPPGIRILCQKFKMRKLLICQNTMDVLFESGAKLKKSSSCEKVRSLCS